MHDGEEKSIEGDLDVGDAELLLDDNVDAGEGVDWHGIDEAGEQVDGEYHEAVRLFLEGAPFICHYDGIVI